MININVYLLKILTINSSRQIEKSYSIRNTASNYFPNYIEINLMIYFYGDKIFEGIKSTMDFYLHLSALYGAKLNTIEDIIIFLDEI